MHYDKDYMEIKFESNDILPTDNIINMHQVTIIIRLVFQKDKKLYPQIYLDEEGKKKIREYQKKKDIKNWFNIKKKH